MRKIRLEPATLSVESFIPVTEQAVVQGTVNANAASRACPATGFTFCVTNCDCTLGCPSIAPCTEPIG